MPRYIDADEALIFIRKTNANYHWLLSQYSASWIYDFIESQPAADVVPRAEVERLQAELDDKQFRCDSCDRIMLTGAEHRACVKQAKAEVTSKIFEDLDSMMLDGAIGGKYPAKVINPDKYAELKKKYTEAKSDE